MEKPVMPIAPSSWEYDERTERRSIYSYTQSLREEYDDEDEDEEEKTPQKEIREIDLAWLISQVPEGVDPSEIKLALDYRASAFAYENHSINFYYEAKIPARKKEYDELLAKYLKDHEQYKKDLRVYNKAYEAFQREEEIRETEEKLAQLKAGKGKK